MKKAEIGELSCKILSIYALISAVTMMSLPIAMYSQMAVISQSRFASIGSFIPTVLLVLFSIALWMGGRLMEIHSEGEETKEDSTGGITPQVLQNIAFSVTGILILIGAIPALETMAVQGVRGVLFKEPLFWIRIAEFIIKLVLGLWLLLGKNSLRRFKSWLLENHGSAAEKDW